MPLSKKRDRQRKKSNLTGLESKSNSNLIQPKPVISVVAIEENPIIDVQPNIGNRRRLQEAGVKLDGNRISLAPQSTTKPLNKESNSKPPVYDPRKHKTGDLVRKFNNGKWVEMIVPELDGEGNIIHD